jgi:four helix bundle protein
MAQSYRDLIAWQKAVGLVLQVYQATEGFPRHELFGLANQLRRAAVSIPSNIAEGQARHSRPEFQRFLRTAKGSLAEMETQLIIATQLGYVSARQAAGLTDKAAEVGRLPLTTNH